MLFREKIPLVCSEDYGRDQSSAQSLLSRHVRLQEEIQAYRVEIHKLDETAAQLAELQVNVETLSSADDAEHVEEVVVPKVLMQYPYEGNGISVAKDEVLALLDRNNVDWWRILKQDGVEGYVPANYCRIVAGETVPHTIELRHLTLFSN